MNLRRIAAAALGICLAAGSGCSSTSKRYRPERVDELFVLYDAGETLALRPVIDRLNSRGQVVAALTLGTSKQILGECEYCRDLQKDCEGEAEVDATRWQRLDALSPEDVARVKACFNPRRVVSGAVSKAQLQIVQAFRADRVRTIAYYDGLSPVDGASITRKFADEPIELWLAGESIAYPLRAMRPQARIEVVGQPTIESWKNVTEQVSHSMMIRELYGYDDLDRRPVILYAGSYGEGHFAAFKLFAEVAAQMPDFRFLISPHPKTEGEIEKGIADAFPLWKPLFVPREIGTLRASVAADIVVSRDSTVGIQALAAGKPSVYFDLPGTKYTNFAIERGWTPRYTDPAAFKQALLEIRSKNKGPLDLARAAGIPNLAASTMTEKLIANGP